MVIEFPLSMVGLRPTTFCGLALSSIALLNDLSINGVDFSNLVRCFIDANQYSMDYCKKNQACSKAIQHESYMSDPLQETLQQVVIALS
jgi:hypothetical protein